MVLEELYELPEAVAVTAHRGFSGLYPENTLLAFAKAADLGVDLIEFDLRASADGTPVILHDAAVDRTSDGNGPVGACSLDELRKLDFSCGRDMDLRIPTFEEALEAIPPSVGLNIQVKETGPPLLAEICRLYATWDLYRRAYLTVSTFDDAAAVRRIDPGIELCVLDRGHALDEPRLREMADHGLRYLQPHRRDLTLELCAAIRRMGFRANVFYSNTDADNRRFIDWGIGGILTDRPDVLLQTLRDLARR